MTTVTVDRAVLEQALAAMDKATRFMSDSDYVKLNQAITALRAALEQQEQATGKDSLQVGGSYPVSSRNFRCPSCQPSRRA